MTVDITLNLVWVLIASVIAIALFLLHSYGGIKLFVKKDEKIATQFLDKFPLVSPEFMQKKVKEQNIENNQEIHEIIEILKEHKARIKELENKH